MFKSLNDPSAEQLGHQMIEEFSTFELFLHCSPELHAVTSSTSTPDLICGSPSETAHLVYHRPELSHLPDSFEQMAN